MSYIKVFFICLSFVLSGELCAKYFTDYLLEMNVEEAKGFQQSVLNLPVSVNDKPSVKYLRIKVTELKSNSGNVYIGGVISPDDLSIYLTEMKSILGDDYRIFRQYQIARDHNTFHVTLINPIEYQKIKKDKLKLNSSLAITLIGLGRVIKNKKISYYVVAQSEEAQIYRQQFLLTRKYFHVTLGFNPQDIYDVDKGIDTLINQSY